MTYSSSIFKSSFRIAAAALMISGYVRMGRLAIDGVIRDQYGGHSQYLTIQGLAIAVATMIIGVFMEVLPFLSPLRAFRRYLFVTAMPLAVVISSIYWTLLIFFPTLIVVDFAQPVAPRVPASDSDSTTQREPFVLPLSMDLALHACPAISLVIDFFAFETKYSASEVNFSVPIIMVLYAVFYGWWVEHCATMNDGIFPYPFLTLNPFNVRLAIYAGAVLLGTISFRLLNKLHPRS